MRPLRGELLLEAWERGADQNDLERPLTLLVLACPGRSRKEVEDLSMAQRELELLELRRVTFGDRLRGYVPCSFCATRLEFDIQIATIVESFETLNVATEAQWRQQEVLFRMRPARAGDLSALLSAANPRRALLERCVTANPHIGAAQVDWEASAVQEFNLLNQGAETRLSVQCPECSQTDEVDLDIGRFLWNEIRHAAVITLREVRELASAYGWSEAEILAMSSRRRAMYLGMTP